MKKSENGFEEKTKGKVWTTYYTCQSISIKTSITNLMYITSNGAFFKQHLEFDIFIETFDGTKGLVLHKGENTQPRIMKQL
jgi:hypothetical protein